MARKIGRNDPCSCGSGKKYKSCCGLSAGLGSRQKWNKVLTGLVCVCVLTVVAAQYTSLQEEPSAAVEPAQVSPKPATNPDLPPGIDFGDLPPGVTITRVDLATAMARMAKQQEREAGTSKAVSQPDDRYQVEQGGLERVRLHPDTPDSLLPAGVERLSEEDFRRFLLEMQSDSGSGQPNSEQSAP